MHTYIYTHTLKSDISERANVRVQFTHKTHIEQSKQIKQNKKYL